MKLYYKAGACSLASHIILTELNIPFEVEAVDTDAGRTASGKDFSQINPKGYVPVLELDGSQHLTEGAAILQHLADSHPTHGLAPSAGSLERARLNEQLVFTSSELHKAFSPYFKAKKPEGEALQQVEANLANRLGMLEEQLSKTDSYLFGETFTIADAYTFVVANWANFIGVSLDAWPAIKAYLARVAARPSVQAAMRAEGLVA